MTERRPGGRNALVVFSPRRLTHDALDELRGTQRDLSAPRTRGECVNGPRPCPYVACRHHLAYDVQTRGSLTSYHPERELDDLPETCSLDVADRGPHTLDEIAKLWNVTRERVRQVEALAIRKALAGWSPAAVAALRELAREKPLADREEFVA